MRTAVRPGTLPDSSTTEQPRQQQPGTFPVAAHGSIRYSQSLADLRIREAAEVTHLDDLDESRIDRGERLECIVDLQNLVVRCARQFSLGGIERLVGSATAPALGLALPNVVDDHRPHRGSGIREEMLCIFDYDVMGTLQPEEGFMHQGCRIQQGITATGCKPRARQPTELGIESR